MTEHTPTPWKLDSQDSDYVRGPGKQYVCVFQGDHNPADKVFLIRAVNSHDELVAAVKTLLETSNTSKAYDKKVLALIAKATK